MELFVSGFIFQLIGSLDKERLIGILHQMKVVKFFTERDSLEARRSLLWMLLNPKLFMWLLLLLCCLRVYELRRPLVVNNFHIGHADTAAYALQGRALAERGSLDINYVTNFYHDYGEDITRHDDHWPHFQAMLYAPVFYFFGSDASIARQCNLFVGAVVLPFLCAWLFFALTGRHWPCALVVGLVLLDGFIFKQSIGLMADNSLCMLVIAYVAALVSSKRHSPYFLVLAGVLGALAWSCKGSQILLLPFMYFGVLVLHGWGTLRKSPFLLGVLAFILIISPRVYENIKDHGKAFHSTQNYVASFFGLENHPWGNWDQHFYGVYWGEDLPSLWERFENEDKFEKSFVGNLRVALGTILLGPDKVSRNRHKLAEWKKYGLLSSSLGLALTEEPYRTQILKEEGLFDDLAWVSYEGGYIKFFVLLFQILGFSLGMMALVLFPVRFLWLKLKGGTELRFIERVGFVLGALMLLHISFPIVLWYVMPRLIMTVQPICLVLGMAACWVTLHQGVKFCGGIALRMLKFDSLSFGGRAFVFMRLSCVSLWCILGFYLAIHLEEWQEEQLRMHPVKVHSKPHYSHYRRVAQSMQGHLPDDAIVMTRNPWELLFHCSESMQAIGLPYAEPRILLAIGKHYGVTHLMNERYRPGLREFLRSGHPGVGLVVDRPSRIYELDYSRFKPEEIATLEELKGYSRRLLGK